MRRAVVAVMGVLLCALAPSVSLAQCTANGAPANCSVPGSVSMTAGRVVRLQMSAGSTALTPPTTGDFDAGFNATGGPTLTVSANAPWTLHIRSASAVWTATNTSPGLPSGTSSTSFCSTSVAISATTSGLVLAGAGTLPPCCEQHCPSLINWALNRHSSRATGTTWDRARRLRPTVACSRTGEASSCATGSRPFLDSTHSVTVQ